MTDKQLNEYIGNLLDIPRDQRLFSDGRWSQDFDCAMAMWTDRYPGTRPPVFNKIGAPPPCFTGETPPIYEGELE